MTVLQMQDNKEEHTDGRRRSTHSHTKQSSGIMLQMEILIGKGLGSEYGGAAGAITIEKVASLNHEIADLKDGINDRFRLR